MSDSAAPRLLVIDDDAVVREFLAALLPLEGFEVVTADCGTAALDVLRNNPTPFAAILCDLHLPDIAEPDLAQQLLTLRAPATPLIAISATRPPDDVLARYDGFLTKPFQPADVPAAIAGATAQRPQASTPQAPTPTRANLPPLDESIFASLSATLPAAQLLELYQLTLADVTQRVERMASAQQSGDSVELRREAHAIKGGCGMVGAVELRELAAAAEGGSPESTPPVADFMHACSRLERMLNARLT